MKRSAFFAFALALCALLACASEPGNLMKMTTTAHMRMAGAPSMPPMTHTQQVCTSAAKPDPRQMLGRRDQTCKVSNYRRTGNTVSYHLMCRGAMQMDGDGSFTRLANGGIHGTTHMTANAGGQAMQMDMTIDGTRIGSCDYTPPPSNTRSTP